MKTPAPVVAELLGASSLDLVCIDAEHAPLDRGDIDGAAAALRAADMPSLVRVPAAEPHLILGALDSGATGVLIPHVRDAESAKAALRAAHYGQGGRGFAGSSRSAGFGRQAVTQALALAAAETVVVAQIEDAEALDALDAIMAVDVDAVFIGRMDLTVSLGETDPSSPTVVAAVELIMAAARRAGRTVGMFTPTTDEARRWRDAGASLFLLESDHAFVVAGAARLALAMRPD